MTNPTRNPNTLSGQAEEKIRSAQQAANETTEQARTKANEVANTISDKASQAANYVSNTSTGEMARDARQAASQVGSQAAEQIDSAMTATGQQISTLAQTVRQNAPQGTVGEYAQSAASALEKGGQYLQEADLTRVRLDLESVIRQYPVASLAAGLGIGYLLARSMRR